MTRSKRWSRVWVTIALLTLVGGCTLLDEDVTAAEAVSNADKEMALSVESISAVSGEATSADSWDLVSCAQRIPKPLRTEQDGLIAIRAMSWAGVSEADARPLLEGLDMRWKTKDTPFVMRSSDDMVLFVGASFNGGHAFAEYERSTETLQVEVYTKCKFTDAELLEAITSQ